jgi:hypothetical protein
MDCTVKGEGGVIDDPRLDQGVADPAPPRGLISLSCMRRSVLHISPEACQACLRAPDGGIWDGAQNSLFATRPSNVSLLQPA